MIEKLKDPKVRKYLYNVIGATIPLLVLTGFLIPQASEMVLLLAAAILGVGGVGMASQNVNTNGEEHETTHVDSLHDRDQEPEGLRGTNPEAPSGKEPTFREEGRWSSG